MACPPLRLLSVRCRREYRSGPGLSMVSISTFHLSGRNHARFIDKDHAFLVYLLSFAFTKAATVRAGIPSSSRIFSAYRRSQCGDVKAHDSERPSRSWSYSFPVPAKPWAATKRSVVVQISTTLFCCSAFRVLPTSCAVTCSLVSAADHLAPTASLDIQHRFLPGYLQRSLPDGWFFQAARLDTFSN